MAKRGSDEWKKKLSAAKLGQSGPKGEKSSNWAGDDVGYKGLHSWMSRTYGTPSLCEHCGATDAKMFDWANKSGEYKRERDDWLRLCRSCHMKQDRTHRRHVYEYNGTIKSLKEWAAHLSISYYTLYSRVCKYGWPIDKALKGDHEIQH